MSNKVVLAEGSGAKFFDVYFMGIGLVIAGHCVYWTLGFSQGFWEFFTALMFVSVGYTILCLCLAEMIGILPFSGGAYGFSRVTTGPYWGFIVGFFDSVSNIIYVSLFVRTCVAFFLYSFSYTPDPKWDPLWWFILYTGMLVLHMLLQKYSFTFISIMGFICLMIPIIYILGTAHLQNFQENVTDVERMVDHQMFDQGTKGFLRLLPTASLMYFGIDMLCLICEDTRDAVHVVPKVIITTFCTLFALAVVLTVCVAAQYPTIYYLPQSILPLIFGFSTIFKTTLNYAAIAVLPSQFIAIYSLMYVFARQMCALSRSHLLPSPLSWTTKENVPYMSLLVGSVLGFLSLIGLKYGTANFDSTLYKMYYAAQMGSITVYIISMLSFIIFRYKYSTLERHFVNWLGIPSAVVGITIFAFTWVGLGFYQQDHYFVIKVYAGLFGFASVFYYLYAKQHQSFSEEEQSILFAAYVIKANSRHRTGIRWMNRKIRGVLNTVDPNHKLFSASALNSPKKNLSRSGSANSSVYRSNRLSTLLSTGRPAAAPEQMMESIPESSKQEAEGSTAQVDAVEYLSPPTGNQASPEDAALDQRADLPVVVKGSSRRSSKPSGNGNGSVAVDALTASDAVLPLYSVEHVEDLELVSPPATDYYD